MHSLQLLIDKCKMFTGIFSLEKAIHASSYLGPGAESLLCSCLVGSFALPGCQSRGLECTAIGEGQLPGAMEGHLVDGVQVEGGLLLTLASRQEANPWNSHRTEHDTCSMFAGKPRFVRERGWCFLTLTWHSGGDSAPQSSHCSHGDLLRGVLCGAGVSSCDHVGFQQSALQVHVVIRESLVHSSQDLMTRRRIRHCTSLKKQTSM